LEIVARRHVIAGGEVMERGELIGARERPTAIRLRRHLAEKFDDFLRGAQAGRPARHSCSSRRAQLDAGVLRRMECSSPLRADPDLCSQEKPMKAILRTSTGGLRRTD
jgi:hypothetical protein